MGIETVAAIDWQRIFDQLEENSQTGVPLARYTAARIGGPADALLEVRAAGHLVGAARLLWQNQVPFLVLGDGSNVLVSDRGVRGMVLVNRARQASFDETSDIPTVSAEAGVNLGALARQAAQRGLSGLEWAMGIPGTLGGAAFGNAGAHGGDMAGNLLVAEILHRNGQVEKWSVERFGYSYRSSLLKQTAAQQVAGSTVQASPEHVILSLVLRLERKPAEEIQNRMDTILSHRRRTQPPGASMGSMFKNPPGDYAGRLIEAVGLKGAQIGDAQISPLHANFFINLGQASAADVHGLIELAQQAVYEKFGLRLELEIELLGEW